MMTAPFGVGSPAVWIDDDPEGMRVTRTAVISVRADGDGWLVETLAGTERVDGRGEGSQLVPLDAEVAAEFEDRDTTSFVVRSTVDAQLDRDVDMFSQVDWRSIERGPGRDHGHEQGHDR
jgi:hypothetical protein